MARPRKEIDFELVKRLCSIFCTKEEIAAVLGIDAETLAARIREEYGMTFKEFFNRYNVKGKISLRRAAFKLAERNPTMAIFMGKQYLGMRDEKYTCKLGVGVEDLTPLAELLRPID